MIKTKYFTLLSNRGSHVSFTHVNKEQLTKRDNNFHYLNMNTTYLAEIFFSISILVFFSTLYIIQPLSLLKKKAIQTKKANKRVSVQKLKLKE